MAQVPKFALATLLLTGCCENPKSQPQSLLNQTSNYLPSPLDGKPNSPQSVHQVHIKVLGQNEFEKDDRTHLKLFFTGGTSPWKLPEGKTGTLTVYCTEDDLAVGTYYFYSFKGD